MELEEKTLSTECIYDGNILHVWKDGIRLPDGNEATREYVKHVGAVAVVALTKEGEVIMERQFRYPFHKAILEIPAGKLNSPDENAELAARRELREETGAVAGKMQYLGDYYGSPAILGENIRLFLATDLTFTAQEMDEDEFLEVFRMPLADVTEEILKGNIPDGKTQAAVLRVAMMAERKEITP